VVNAATVDMQNMSSLKSSLKVNIDEWLNQKNTKRGMKQKIPIMLA